MGIYTEEKYLTIQPMELVTNEGLTIGLPPIYPHWLEATNCLVKHKII